MVVRVGRCAGRLRSTRPGPGPAGALARGRQPSRGGASPPPPPPPPPACRSISTPARATCRTTRSSSRICGVASPGGLPARRHRPARLERQRRSGGPGRAGRRRRRGGAADLPGPLGHPGLCGLSRQAGPVADPVPHRSPAGRRMADAASSWRRTGGSAALSCFCSTPPSG